MGAYQRRKGHNFERKVARELSALTGLDFRRGQQSRDGADAADVVDPTNTFWIETKIGKAPPPLAALRQAEEAVGMEADIPVAIIQNDRDQPYVVMSYENWKEMLSTYLLNPDRPHRSSSSLSGLPPSQA